MPQLVLPGLEVPKTEVRNVFFGLLPPPSVRDAVYAAGEAIRRHGTSRNHAIDVHRIHMTLLYIDTFFIFPEDVVRRAVDAGNRIELSAFELVLDIAGSFPQGDKPSWIGCRTTSDGLSTLHGNLVNALRRNRQRFRSGTRFVPHVTLSRNNDSAFPETPIAPISWRVSEFCLIDSVRNERDFSILKKWPLRDP